MKDEKTVKICLIEDDEDDYVLIRAMVQQIPHHHFAIDWVSTADEGRRAIESGQYDVYLLDYRLGDTTGLDLLELAMELGCRAPIIVLTGQNDIGVDLKALKLGAADYLNKAQLTAQLLERSIRYSMERNKTLEALRESEERYALSARGANDGLWVWDLKQDRVYYSERWKSMLGYTEGEVGTSPDEWLHRVHPDDIDRLQAAVRAHREGHSPHFENEHRMRGRDGEYRWMLSRGLAVRDIAGKASRIAGSQTDITERKQAEEQLLHDALHDGLTGLPNRTLFMDRLERALWHGRRRNDYLFAVLFLDLDRFKVINDSLGHVVGDALLVEVSRRLQRCVRPNDTVARLGGDEFAMLLDDLDDANDASRVAERIHAGLRQPFHVGENDMFTTASIGIALSARAYHRPQDMLRDADTAMYRAKSMGKARHEVFDQAMHARAVTQLQLETDLRRALERDELLLHYQPIVSMGEGSIVGFEALVRWRRNDQIMAPAEFLPTAEDTGLILPIGEWVLTEACRQAKEWQTKFGERLYMSINLSARQFVDATLVTRISDAVERNSLQSKRLVLEMTESAVISDAASASKLLTELRSLGVKLSLDDFGTGYSSLSTLHQFPFHELKVDRSFVSGTGTESQKAGILSTIASLAGLLNMDLVLEGVETEEQLHKLRRLRTAYAQGFYFSRPVDADHATKLLLDAPRWSTVEGHA
jgi:diguanylate cyclase (GGDEF)-like protein/PAS domain S-box-containing protein